MRHNKKIIIILTIIFLTSISQIKLIPSERNAQPEGLIGIPKGASLWPPEGPRRALGEPPEAYKSAKQDIQTPFRFLSQDKLTAAGELFYLLSADDNEKYEKEIKELCNAVGFRLSVTHCGEERIYMIIEKEKDRRGRGFYLFRRGEALPVLLQAPHGGDDLFTDSITMKLFLENKVKAAAFNTVTRKVADLAHMTGTCFQQLTVAFARRYSQGTVFQLHGYVRSKRKTSEGASADFIISDGTKQPQPNLAKAVRCLSKKTKAVCRLFPRDVKELGATLNTQGQALRKINFQGFIHVEAALNWRKKLKADAMLRKHIADCFLPPAALRGVAFVKAPQNFCLALRAGG